MSDHDHDHDHEEHHTNYVKIWGILLGLLAVSIIGPMFEIQWLTLLTAFGIAVVKAYLVVKYFMHVTIEPKFVAYMLSTVLAFMFLFFAGVAPDVMKHEGTQWENQAAKAEVQRGLEAAKKNAGHH